MPWSIDLSLGMVDYSYSAIGYDGSSISENVRVFSEMGSETGFSTVVMPVCTACLPPYEIDSGGSSLLGILERFSEK